MPFVTQIMNQSYPSYPGSKRLEPFNQDQRQAFGAVEDYAQPRYNPGYGYATQMAHQVGQAPAGHVSTLGTYGRVGQEQRFQDMPQNIDTDRLVDEGGRLGKISDYMNPYVQGVIDPQIREIGKAADRARVQAGQAATFGGAFGDARHGVADSLTRGEEFEAKSDAAGRGWSDAYNQAMGLRGADEQRMMAADQFNQQAREQALGRQLGAQQFNVGTQQSVRDRQLQAALANQSLREQMFGRRMASGQAANDYGLAANADYMQRLNAFMNTGQMQQQQGQKLRDYDYANFQGGVQWPFTQFNALLSTLSGQPTQPVQTTQQTSGGNSGWMNLIGSMMGAFL